MPISENAHRTLEQLSLADEAALVSGASFWATRPVAHAGVPAITLTDGPHGVRKQIGPADRPGLTDSVPATCFPPAAALASSWDADLIERVGAALGREAAAEDVQVLLGPGINIKRTPLCGRNFEYLSEDPCLTGVLGAALVRGIQSAGVAACLKHFAANNQETDRLLVSADIDERPLREIYLQAFRRVVTTARPWSVMCSYNRINGVHASQDRWLLTDVLRGEWGFDGLVVSDWGAVVDGPAAVAAGLDLEMPARAGAPAEIVKAVESGRLDRAFLDEAAGRVLSLIEKTAGAAQEPYDSAAHHALAREAAARCAVLLKNDGELLPLATDTQIAVIGEFARTPRYQGAGSSQVVPTRLDAALDEIRSLTTPDVPFAPGYPVPGAAARRDADELREEAVALARDAETVLLFLGLPGSAESEGFDRDDLELPADQLALLDAVLAVNSTVVVILANGGVVRVAGWDERVPAILEGWLLGQAGGGAVADILFGRTAPSGRLAETIPARLEDTPAFLNFPGENHRVRYGEGLFVGYRWYDGRDIPVSYPFGHGLTYTRFDYGRAVAGPDGEGGLAVEVTVHNVGARAGREVVQVYVGQPGSVALRAPRELKAFAVLDLPAGGQERVRLVVPRTDLAHYDTTAGRWAVAGGRYEVAVGASSRDLRHIAAVEVDGEAGERLSAQSTVAEWLADPVGRDLLSAAIRGDAGFEAMLGTDAVLRRMLEAVPLGRAAVFPGSPLTPDAVAALVEQAAARRQAPPAGESSSAAARPEV